MEGCFNFYITNLHDLKFIKIRPRNNHFIIKTYNFLKDFKHSIVSFNPFQLRIIIETFG